VGAWGITQWQIIMKDYWKTRVIISNECWIWQLCIGKNGYGFCKGSTAHKRSYEDHIGDVPNGLVLRHTCNNKSCCNPAHLVLGSQRDNYFDMNEAKRKELHYKAGKTLSNKIKNGEIIPDTSHLKIIASKGGRANAGIPKSKSHREAISKANRKHN
jgi:hypothetical protein